MANRLQNVLKISMVITLIGSFLILASGLFVYYYMYSLVTSYFDVITRDLNTTKFLINSQESIVPARDDLPEEIDLGNWPQSIALAVSGLGGCLFLFAMFGYISVTSRNSDCLLMFVILLIVGIVCQFLIFGCIIDLNSDLNSRTKETLIDSLRNKYEIGARSSSTFTFLMNSVMLMGQCCGIEGPADFFQMGILNFSYVVQGEEFNVPVIFPLACCKRDYINSGFLATVECAKSKEIDFINKRGCYEEMYGYVHDNYGIIVAVIFILLICWEMLQILTGLVILFAPSKVEMAAVNQVLEAAEFEDINKKDFRICDSNIEQSKPLIRKPIFVPLARVPSADCAAADTTSQIW